MSKTQLEELAQETHGVARFKVITKEHHLGSFRAESFKSRTNESPESGAYWCPIMDPEIDEHATAYKTIMHVTSQPGKPLELKTVHDIPQENIVIEDRHSVSEMKKLGHIPRPEADRETFTIAELLGPIKEEKKDIRYRQEIIPPQGFNRILVWFGKKPKVRFVEDPAGNLVGSDKRTRRTYGSLPFQRVNPDHKDGGTYYFMRSKLGATRLDIAGRRWVHSEEVLLPKKLAERVITAARKGDIDIHKFMDRVFGY